jgi:hypothetical protein
MWINGGGAAAILTFIGHLMTTSPPQLSVAKGLVTSLIAFSVGVLATVGGGIFSFFQLRALSRMQPEDVPLHSCGMGICWGIAGLAFIAGAWSAVHVFLKGQ